MTIALVIMCVFISRFISDSLYKNHQSDMLTKANIVADAAVNSQWDEQYLDNFLKTALAGTGTRGIILNEAGKTVTDTNYTTQTDGLIFIGSVVSEALSGNNGYQKTSLNDASGLCVAAPIIEGDSVTGAVYLAKNMSETDTLVNYITAGLIAFSVLIVLLMMVLSIRLSNIAASPLNEFVTAAQEISKGNFDKRLSVKGNSDMDQLANALNYMCSELEHLEAKRRKFVSDASHELKTPMATIKLVCDSITSSENPDTGMVREFLSDLSDEVDRLTRIIERLLLLTKLDSKEATLSPELVDFGMMLQRISSKLTPMALGKNITLATDIPSDMPPVLMDYDQIWETVYNIVDNAIKYSKINTTVKITATVQNKEFILRVYDSGKGIPDEFKERIFERFFRLDDSRARDTGGTGLGLAIAREAVALHKGRLYIEDNPEGGSCFVMVLPQTQEPPKKANGGDEE